ncbi:AAA family ATPase [Actinopolymorpha sp. B9G3]|uniref:AAA family ATPase n=1 Tax=Actinopolymorpha sp. B9G3 TaxID=3158970 RepID=UPI0032D95111
MNAIHDSNQRPNHSSEEPTVPAINPTDAPFLRPVRDGRGEASKPDGRLRTHWTADELMAMEFVPPVWAVPGIICEGVSLLCGPPKVGKSWASLGLGLSVAAGGQAFHAIPVQGGPVLYLALEDTPRRLQSRMGKILGDRSAPSTLTLATACPLIGQGGDDAIAGWLDRNRGARMVIIDVFAKIRGAAPPGASAYEADYAAVGAIKRLADNYAVPFVLVHHVRKAGSDDFLAEVSGTNGVAGAADATLVLKRGRGQADGVLYVTGRDVDEAEYALSFNAASGAWMLLDGPADEHQTTDTRAAILRYLRANTGSGPRAIAQGTGLGEPNVKATCRRMLAAGLLTADGKARYSVPDGA